MGLLVVSFLRHQDPGMLTENLIIIKAKIHDVLGQTSGYWLCLGVCLDVSGGIGFETDIFFNKNKSCTF